MNDEIKKGEPKGDEYIVSPSLRQKEAMSMKGKGVIL